jgi:hypothetical protein
LHCINVIHKGLIAYNFYFSSIAPISVHAAFEKVSIKHKKYSRVCPFTPAPP